MSRGGATPTPTPEPVVIESWVTVTNNESPMIGYDVALGEVEGVAGTPYAIVRNNEHAYETTYLVCSQFDISGTGRDIKVAVQEVQRDSEAEDIITNLSDTQHQALKAFESENETEVKDYMWQFMPNMIPLTLSFIQNYDYSNGLGIFAGVLGTYENIVNPVVNILHTNEQWILKVVSRNGIITVNSQGKPSVGANLTEEQLIAVGNAILTAIPALGNLINNVEARVGQPYQGQKYSISTSLA